MVGPYTISELAKAAGVPTTTVRYYERVGLLRPEGRSAGNYRLYTEESLLRLKFIRAARATGFTVEDVKLLLGPGGRQSPPCSEVQHVIQQRLAHIKKRLRDLRQVQRVLKLSFQKCIESQQAGYCHVVEALRGLA